MKTNLTIRIIDDDPSIHDSLSLIFDLAGLSVRHYYSAEEFIASDFFSDSGCAIVDLRMNGMSGLELQKKLQARQSNLPLIFLSGHGDIETAVSAMQEGAVTFLTKPVSASKLMQAVRRATDTSNADKEEQARLKRDIESLSEREHEIFLLLKEGLNCRAIADRLGISMRTVEAHRNGIMRKLHCSSVRELEEKLACCPSRPEAVMLAHSKNVVGT